MYFLNCLSLILFLKKCFTMGTSERLDNAIKKLYTAFHNGTLNPECCKQCAVGNILDNSDRWRHFTDNHGSTILNYVGLVNENLGKKINGYKPSELIQIEAAFLGGCGYALPLHHTSNKPKDPTSKEILFEGLGATVSFLCALEGVPDGMDYSKVFDLQQANRKPLLVG